MLENFETPSIVVFAFPRLGDFIMCHSLVRLLRTRFPNRPIDIVARHPGIAAARLMPEIREGIADFTVAGKISIRQRLTLASKLRNRYQSAYIVSRAWKAGIVPLLAGIPERIGWFGEARVFIINRPRFDEKRQTGTSGRAAALGIPRGEATRIKWPEPQLIVPSEMMADWVLRNDKARGDEPVLAIAPGSSDIARAWPVERFAEVAKRHATKGWRVWVLGTAEEGYLGNAIKAVAGSSVTVMTHNSVSDLACGIKAASVFLGNDSGPMHLAAALGKPCLGVFGPTDNRPINSHVQIVAPDRAAPWAEQHWPEVDRVDGSLQVLSAQQRI
jgi:heptosyltransferase II